MLSFLERLAAAFWDYCRRVIQLILPFFYRASDFRGIGRGLLLAVQFLVLILVLGLLYWANVAFDLGTLLRAPTLFGINLSPYWLPILFLLFYILCWLGWWVWRLLGPEELSSDFPDIDLAWDEALAALHQVGIDLREAPLFLCLGRPAGGEEALFQAANLELMVKQAPRRADAPLHVYANRDGIYLTCAGASLLGRQAVILAGETNGSGGDSSAGSEPQDGADDPFKTLRPKGRHQREIQAILSRVNEERRELTAEEKQRIRNLTFEDKMEGVQRQGRPVFLKSQAEVEKWTARFKHLCRLIVRDRRPYCPINGMIWLVPIAAADNEEDASQTVSLCQKELSAARAVLQAHCPLLALVCDLETVTGCHEFLERFPSNQRQRRLGQRFPLVPDLPPEEIPRLIEGGVSWMCQALLPHWVYRLFRLESAGGEDRATAVRGNRLMYQLMCEISQRNNRLARLFTHGLIYEPGEPLLFGGCYLAATGRNTEREQAFVAGVLRRLVEGQNFVSWTNEALIDEADCRRWTTYGYTGLTLCSLALIVLGIVFWHRSG